MDYDLISKMCVEELKNYLRVRNLRISGRKEELIARVFSAAENFVQPVKTAQEVESNLKEEYQKKLKINDRTLPDPFKIPHGWMDEQEGIKFWPMVLYPDIFSYLMFYPSELGSSDLNDYKNSKAYSYYKSGWLQPLAYHDLSGSNFCIFKGTCRKSQAINDPFHKLWLILEKSGKIMSCHCTCMAGMSQTCNHVAAALYRIEAAVRIGLTNTACTSTANEWLPNRKQVAPTKIKDLNFSRDNFSDRGKRKRPLVSTPKKNFDPLQHCGEKLLSLNEIADELKEIIPESILFTAVPKPEIDFVRECLSISDVTQPSDIYSISDILAMSKTKTEFECNLVAYVTPEKVIHIEKLTQGQSENTGWYNFRKHVISASKGHDVLTKMKKVKSGGGGSVNIWALNQKVSGMSFISPNIPALKYGRTMEINAVNAFKDNFLQGHKNVKVLECGLYLDKNTPYIGASPDRIITCDCCLPACLEVKCPFSINYTTPKDLNVKLPYLTHMEEKTVLNKNHKYYTQCVMQMGVTGFSQCHFVVWTPHGMVHNIINFEPEVWNSMRKTFIEYYDTFYLKSIFSG